jgi:hydrogenase expression/formation protein HypE
VANEGKMVVILPSLHVGAALDALRRSPYGTNAVEIGRVLDGPAGRVMVRTPFGNRRILLLHHGEILPRIC